MPEFLNTDDKITVTGYLVRFSLGQLCLTKTTEEKTFLFLNTSTKCLKMTINTVYFVYSYLSVS